MNTEKTDAILRLHGKFARFDGGTLDGNEIWSGRPEIAGIPDGTPVEITFIPFSTGGAWRLVSVTKRS